MMAGRFLCSWCYRQGLQKLRRVAVLGTPASHPTRRCLSAVAEDPLPAPTGDKSYPPKIEKIVQEISQLTLLETSQLNELLKSTLNIPDAPMMATGAMPVATGAAAAEDEAAPKKEEQSEFTIRLVKFADDSKIKLIKEVKTLMDGMNLVQAKKFVESLPQVIKSDVSKEEAEKLKSILETVGGTVELE